VVKYGWAASRWLDDFLKEQSLSSEDVVSDFLPLPDADRRGNRIAVLPHASSLLNLLARMNRVTADLGSPDLNLVHDEQLQFEPTIEHHHQELSSGRFEFLDDELDSSGLPYAGYVRYGFSGEQRLHFLDSKNSPGVQAADVVAATCRVYYDQTGDPDRKVRRALEETAELLAELTGADDGQGVNTVAPYDRMRTTFSREWPPVPPFMEVPDPLWGALGL
jgi:hypothetical protein